MSNPVFIPLAIRSSYSLLESMITPGDIAKWCKRHEVPAAAVTDRNNLFGALDWPDIAALIEDGIRVRLCKGAYKEPPDKAFPKKADVDANYDLLTKLMLDASLTEGSKLSEDGRIPPIPAIASHDERRIEFAKTYASKVGLPKESLEFQMLFGIRRDLQEKLVKEGYPVRVYVPFGTHWYPYFMRRLAERPANIWFFVSNFFRG